MANGDDEDRPCEADSYTAVEGCLSAMRKVIHGSSKALVRGATMALVDFAHERGVLDVVVATLDEARGKGAKRPS